MPRAFSITVLCALAVFGCGRETPPEPESPAQQASQNSSVMMLPATVEGSFAISVEKGDVDAKGISEVNFGTLAVNGVELLVEVSGGVLRAGKVPREGGKVRATLGSRTDAYGAPTYIVTAMEML